MLNGLNLEIASANTLDTSKITVISSESITIDNSTKTLKVYLNIFKPNSDLNFRFELHNAAALDLFDRSQKISAVPNTTLQFSYPTGAILYSKDMAKPIKEYKDASGNALIQFFATPPDFPNITLVDNTTLINKRVILTTPIVATGSYAIASKGADVLYFYRSANTLIGFRKLTDSAPKPTISGTPVYAFLEQTRYDVTATSPGSWRLLNSKFQVIQRINSIETKFGSAAPEGHAITVSPTGNALVITANVRKVDSSWLKRSFKLPILDCDIVEVFNGKAVHEFSFWDWAVAHKSLSGPLLEAMPIVQDPQNPATSPIDICHANSLQYNASTHQYLISLRSPSILMLLSSDLKTVNAIIPTNGSFQHFARFKSANEITALANYTFGKTSSFQEFKLTKGKWILHETAFPVHVIYCGNTQYIDATHVWLGGGCGPIAPDTAAVIYELKNGSMKPIGQLKMRNLVYTYRADLI